MIEVFLALSCKNCGRESLIESPKRKKKNHIFKLFKKVPETKWGFVLECPHCGSTNKYSRFDYRFTYIQLLIGGVIGLILAISF